MSQSFFERMIYVNPDNFLVRLPKFFFWKNFVMDDSPTNRNERRSSKTSPMTDHAKIIRYTLDHELVDPEGKIHKYLKVILG